MDKFASAVIYGLITGENLTAATECGAALAMTAPAIRRYAVRRVANLMKGV